METLEELKAIADKAESGGYTLTSLCGSNFYRREGFYWIGFDADESEFIEYEMPATRAISDIERIIELMEVNQSLQDKINQLDKAITDIGKHIQKSEPSFSMAGVDIGDSQKRIIEYIRKMEVL